MAVYQQLFVLATAKVPTLVRNFHTSGTAFLEDPFKNQRKRGILNLGWRQKKGLTLNPNGFGPLTNLPDYTFKDGRPTPFSSGQLVRINKQQGYLAKINKLVGEIDYAVERHAKLQKQAEEERQKILDQKLKPKNELLLTD